MQGKKVLVTGSEGQLGSSVLKLREEFPRINFSTADIKELDITIREDVERFLILDNPDFVVNCAAYTAVDDAEKNEDSAFAVNKSGPGNLAVECRKYGIPLIHISTDYVFSGKGKKPYLEDDPAGPVTAYGRSKLAGEREVIDSGVSGMIIRTSWLYSEFGNNFVKSMIRLGQSRPEISVVNDQYGSPTYAEDLARAILTIINDKAEILKHQQPAGIFHFSNQGICTWHDLALAVMEYKGINCRIIPITSEEYPRPAKRPGYSVLDTKKIRDIFTIEIPHWRVSLLSCIKNL